MIGYHFTSLENWTNIQKIGLFPGLIVEESIRRVTPDKYGIWLHTLELAGEELLGMQLHWMALLRCQDICELKVEYNTDECIKAYSDLDSLKITINFSIKAWHYMIKKPVIILRSKVSPRNIKLNRQWSLEQNRN